MRLLAQPARSHNAGCSTVGVVYLYILIMYPLLLNGCFQSCTRSLCEKPNAKVRAPPLFAAGLDGRLCRNVNILDLALGSGTVKPSPSTFMLN